MVGGGFPRRSVTVCLGQDRGSNRPEKWLSRFLVPDQLRTVWGRLRLPGADLLLIPDCETDPVFPPIVAFFPPTTHD